jgi:outer membrane receptor for ferrienterochelin and colicin
MSFISTPLFFVLLFLMFFGQVLSAPCAQAEEQQEEKNVIKMESLVVTGSRTSSNAPEKMSVPVQIVTNEELQNIGAISMGQALEAIQGVEFIQSPDMNTAPGVQTLRMRGMDANHVLVLIDGRRMPGTRPDKEGFSFTDISGINISDIERIEVLRDGASAQYGSDAVAGVINIVLRKRSPRLTVNSQYGISSRDDAEEKKLEVSTGLPVSQSLFLNISANGKEINHYDRTPDNPRWTSPDVEQKGASIKGSLELNPAQIIDTQFRYNTTETVMRIGTSGEQDKNRTSNKDDYYGGLAWEGDIKTLHFETGFGLSRSYTEYRQSENSEYRGDLSSDMKEVYLHMNWDYNPWLTLFFGSSFNNEDVDAPYRDFVESRDTFAVFAETGITALKSLRIQVSGRLEEFSDFGTNLAPKVSASYEWSDNLAFRTSVSRSFQVPTLFQLHDNFRGAMDWNDIFGNPDLEPSEGVNYNVGFVWKPFGQDGPSLSADFYRNDIDNMIQTYSVKSTTGIDPSTANDPEPKGEPVDWTLVPERYPTLHNRTDPATSENAVTTYINLEGKSVFKGIEVEAAMPLPWGFHLSATAGYLLARNSQDNDLTNRPRSRFNATLNYNRGRFGANLRYIYRGKYLSDRSPRERIEPFDFINAHINYKLTSSINLFAGGRNLLDEKPPVDLEKYEGGHMESMIDSALGAYYYGGVRLGF